jgi:hypothetical protein
MREEWLKASEHNHAKLKGFIANEALLNRPVCYIATGASGRIIPAISNLQQRDAGTSFSRHGTSWLTSGFISCCFSR